MIKSGAGITDEPVLITDFSFSFYSSRMIGLPFKFIYLRDYCFIFEAITETITPKLMLIHEDRNHPC